MGSRHLRRILVSVLLLIALVVPLWSAPAQAIRLKGPYNEDGLEVIRVLREALDTPDDSDQAADAHSEAQAAMDAFNGRYHGDRFDKMQSYTTLRTVFNTLASTYRVGRPLTAEKKERVLAQLRRAESGFETAN
ncbi:MAG: hypothetical protein OHK0012_08020 [Synechococcales cyanobacterium]